jgi:hypothetical protein
MRDVDVDFYGSDEDLDALEKMLRDSGFEQVMVETVLASSDAVPRAVTFTIKKGIGAAIKAFLSSRKKCMVSRYTPEGEKQMWVFENYSVEEIERLVALNYNLNIRDIDTGCPDPLPPSEGQMGFHVGREPDEPSED